MTDGVLWFVAGITLCGIELLLPGAFLLWIGLAAIAGGGATLALDLKVPGQLGAFLVSLVGCLYIPLLRRSPLAGVDGGVNAPSSGLLGKTCRALAFDGVEGRVSFRDGAWPARMTVGEAPIPGTALRIVGLDGTTLVVAPMDISSTAPIR